MNTTKLIIAAMLCTSAQATMAAECYYRSTTGSKAQGTVSMISDVRNWVTPAMNGQKKCIATFKALDEKKQWHNGAGEYVFLTSVSEDKACGLALERGKAELTDRIYGNSINSVNEMVCDEAPLPKTRPVQIGEVIQISDVTIHPNKQAFVHKGAYCNWFVETSVTEKELYQWQGIICKTGRPGVDTWTVIDKF
jgi:hypothetical protein